MSTRRMNNIENSPSRSASSNPAKSTYSKGGRKKGQLPNSRGTKKRIRKTNKKKSSNLSRMIGMVIAIVLLITSIIFSWSIYTLNMLPINYLMLIIGAVCVITGIIFVDQTLSRGRGIPGKVVAILMIISLSTGSFYLIKTNSMLAEITNNSGIKINHMIVAVRIDDTAENIENAKDYNFGVQYALQKEDVTKTVIAIETEIDKTIKVTDCGDISSQAEALLNGDVDAVIYNEAFAGIIEEENPEYVNQVKVIYTYDIEEIMEEKIVEGDITADPFCVYISGIDVYGSISKNSRSDVNILVYVNPTSRQILLVNTPRDYYVSFPGVTGSTKDKLTHAGIYGVDRSVATLEQLYGTNIHYYTRVNFTSLVTMIDALGGIDVYSEQSFTTLHDPFYVSSGMNTFTGSEALAFVRERYALSGGDNQRGRNQQAVITAMINKVVSPAIITGATGLISSVGGNVDTDMPQSEMQELIKMQLSEGGGWNIKSMAAIGTGDSQYCYSYSGGKLYVMQPNQDSINKIKLAISALNNGDALTDAIVAN